MSRRQHRHYQNNDNMIWFCCGALLFLTSVLIIVLSMIRPFNPYIP